VEEDFPLVGGVPTCVLKCGQPQPGKPMILIIPGNPGVAGYYEDFMVKLYELSDSSIPVWCVSHAGHVIPSRSMPKYKEEDLYSVFGQVQHKLYFIQSEIPYNCPLILIGHSIGCFNIIHLLERLDPQRVLNCCLLFPVLENLWDTPNFHWRYTGKIYQIDVLRWLASFATSLVYYTTPEFVRRQIIKQYFQEDVSECAMRATVRVWNPISVLNTFYMAKTYIKVLYEADYDIIEKHLDKLLFYYGTTDGWVPIKFYENMKKRFPSGNIHLCDREIRHAFVLDSSEEMAETVWKWLVARNDSLRKTSLNGTIDINRK